MTCGQDKMTRKFQRRIEDFVCANCSWTVKGSGYTNHCPRCLWSRHVDMHPGDRAADCRGLMAPIQVAGAAENYRILHRCTKCGRQKWNQASPDDDFDALLKLAETLGKQNFG